MQKLCLSLLVIAVLALQSFACTGTMQKTASGEVVHGRTVEFGIDIDMPVVTVPRHYQFTGSTSKGNGIKYKAKYAAMGIAMAPSKAIVDGINEKGLAAGVFYFNGYAQYTKVTDNNSAKALSPVELINYLLTQYATVDEVKKAIADNEVVVTDTVFKAWGFVPPFHWIVYDKAGNSIAVEPVEGKLVVTDNPLGVFTNGPELPWHLKNLQNYINLTAYNPKPKKLNNGVSVTAYGQGGGQLGIPGDPTPQSRFIKVAYYSNMVTKVKTVDEAVMQVFHILNNFDIPYGSMRGEKGTKEEKVYDYTQLTLVRDPNNLKFYYKTFDDQTIRFVQLTEENMNAKEMKIVQTKGTKQRFVDMNQKFNPIKGEMK